MLVVNTKYNYNYNLKSFMMRNIVIVGVHLTMNNKN